MLVVFVFSLLNYDWYNIQHLKAQILWLSYFKFIYYKNTRPGIPKENG